MADGTSIEWTDASWNPIRARDQNTGKLGWQCEIITPGCEHCYAQSINKRLGTGLPYLRGLRGGVEVFLDEKMLTQPLRWRRPRMIFVGSMTDLFGDWVTDDMLDRIFAVMALCPQHTFQCLTKRAERMRDYIGTLAGDWILRLPDANLPGSLPITKNDVERRFGRSAKFSYDPPTPTWPLRNIWCGVSVEDQRRADERIPHLLATPAAARWISAEPLLGPVDLEGARGWLWGYEENGVDMSRPVGERVGACIGWTPPLDWVIVGGESGHGARPFNIDWARSIIAQCHRAAVPCFVKQLGARPYWAEETTASLPLKDRKGGNIEEWPEELRVREFPLQ